MSDDSSERTADAPKTALEIAMERLRQKDAREGVVAQALTDDQKAAIAEARSIYQANVAQAEVMPQSALASVHDPDARAVLDEQYRRDRDRFASERDAKIAT